MVDEGMDAQAAIDAPRVHWESDVVYCEPGIDADALEAEGRTVARFRAPNLFFGGAQCVVRTPDGTLRVRGTRAAAARPLERDGEPAASLADDAALHSLPQCQSAKVDGGFGVGGENRQGFPRRQRGQRRRGAGKRDRAPQAAHIDLHSLIVVLAVILESGEPQRLYTALSLLVSADEARGLVSFGALPALIEADFDEHLAALWSTARGGGDPRRLRRGRRQPRLGGLLLGDLDAPIPQRDEGRAISRRLIIVAAAFALTGCGADSADLFEVRRTGEDANANVDMVVNDGGTVTCNGGKAIALPGTRLLDARELARGLEKQASLSIELPPGPGATLRYVVRLSNGRVAFSDTSTDRPKIFDELVGFSADVIENVCGIER